MVFTSKKKDDSSRNCEGAMRVSSELIKSLLLVLVVVVFDHQVDGSCGFNQVPPFIDSDWVACLKEETVKGQRHQCPLGLQNVEDEGHCSEDYSGGVCCLLRPTLNLHLEKAACTKP
ncbi:hypothetical protein OS493_023009 [Desmophyllum pertusum]|uniref:Uncharacterized protein n=1 Tax=Desmophyllum pertusum TaxID=174260 RepID=A0A9W9ZE12_9CNID|nr:hypothetical protein OS493_023009 [Desmophyllum pertusum]